MAFLWTLQRYVFKEMAKTFLLSSIALTGVLGLGGGVLNLIKLGDATPQQLVHLMALVLPAAVALTLPIAALFSAAATYGRLSADNEFVACRSGGINLHLLFLPALLLSLVSALVTFLFINFVIPGMVRNLNEFIGADVASMIERRLSRPRGITLGGRFRIYADGTHIDASDPGRIVLERVAFVEVEDENWIRYGTARDVQLGFDTDGTQRWVTGRMNGLSFYDSKAHRFTDLESQAIRGTRLPSLVPNEIKFQTLGGLLYYDSHPDEWHAVQEATQRLRVAVGRWMAYDALWAQWEAVGAIVVEDSTTRRTIRAASAARIPREGGIDLSGVTIAEERFVVETNGGPPASSQEDAAPPDQVELVRTYEAQRAVFEVSGGSSISECAMQLHTYEVVVTDGQRKFKRARETLGPMDLPGTLMSQVERIGDKGLFDLSTALPANDLRHVRWQDAVETRNRAVREIRGTIHQRMAFSVSVVVLVLLGAVLGIIFRGSQMVTAFGISFIPSVVVIVTIVMGKQMSANQPTHVLGLAAIWSGILLVAALDVWVLGRVLRR